jgi:tellurite resistance protein TerC
MIMSLENMLAYHAVFSLHRVASSSRPKGLFWGIGLAMFIRFVLLVVGGALITGSSIARMVIGGVLVVVGGLSIMSLIDSVQQRRAKAFQIASSVCTVSEKFVPTKWWQYFSSPAVADEPGAGLPILQPGQSKWAIGVPVFVTILAIEFCDSFLTIWNTFAVVAQTSSLFVTYSSTAFALMTVRSLYLVMVAQTTAIEPRLLHTSSAGGIAAIAIGANLIMTYANLNGHPSLLLSMSIGVISLALLGTNLLAWYSANRA